MNDIDRYLDRLLLELRGSAGDVRRILAEAEEHLRDAAQDGVESGLPEEEAQRRAVERFGSPHMVARRFGGAALPRGEIVRALARALVPFGAIGLVAVGISGAVSEVFGHAFGPAFVSGDLPWVRYSAQRCAEVQEYFPGRSCQDAVTLDHWGEVVQFRVAFGVLGLLVLGGYLLARRRARPADVVLRPGLVPVAGVTLYGLAAAVLLGQSVDTAMLGGVRAGSGQWLSGGIVALVVAVAYGRTVCRSLLVRA
jgi:hypothetical protein